MLKVNKKYVFEQRKDFIVTNLISLLSITAKPPTVQVPNQLYFISYHLAVILIPFFNIMELINLFDTLDICKP